jgi:hypothetical protein
MLPDNGKLMKIAELVGWTRIDVRNYTDSWEDYSAIVLTGVPPNKRYCGSASYERIPDYLKDLNAIHEIEALIPLKKLEKYWDNLATICSRPQLTLTAAQRSEAFVLTMEGE